MPSAFVTGFPGEILLPTSTTRRAVPSSVACASWSTASIPASSPGAGPREQVIQGEHGVGLAAPEVRLQLNDGVAAPTREAVDCPDQQALQAFRQVGPPKELDRVAVLVRPFAEVHLPEVGCELGLLVAPARDVLVGRDDLPPWLEAGHGSASDGGARLPAPFPARLLVEAHPQQLHLEPFELIRLRRRYRGEKPAHRVQCPIGVIAGEALLVGPLVAVVAQLTDETPVRPPENRAKDVVPRRPHQPEQPGYVPLGRWLVRQYWILGVVAELESVEPSRLQGALDLPIDERTQTCLEQIQRLADPFVIGYCHLPLPPSMVLDISMSSHCSPKYYGMTRRVSSGSIGRAGGRQM